LFWGNETYLEDKQIELLARRQLNTYTSLMDPDNLANRFHSTEKGRENIIRRPRITLREQQVISEYIKTGKKGASYATAYSVKNLKRRGTLANTFFKKPKIQDALQKALKDSKFDDAYAVDKMKKIVDAGMENLDITRPDTVLKVLETYFKITNKMGGGNKVAIKLDIESQAKKMDINELTASIRELDKKTKRIFAIIGSGKTEEGEIVK
jgi:hypothetical protein